MANSQTRELQQLARKHNSNARKNGGALVAYYAKTTWSMTGKSKKPTVDIIEYEHGSHAFRPERAWLKNKRQQQPPRFQKEVA